MLSHLFTCLHEKPPDLYMPLVPTDVKIKEYAKRIYRLTVHHSIKNSRFTVRRNS